MQLETELESSPAVAVLPPIASDRSDASWAVTSAVPLRRTLNPRAFCGYVVSLAATGALVVAVLNYVVNPYAQYSTRVIPPVVQTSRTQKVDLFQALAPDIDALVIGSSRVMKLEPDYLAEKTASRFFNAGMNYAKPEDYLAFTRLYSTIRGRAPKLLVIGVDVASFSNTSNVDARLLSEPRLAPLIPETKEFDGRFDRWQQLLSWQQTISSLKSVRKWLTLPASEEAAPEYYRDDGLLVYREREQAIQEGVYELAPAIEYNQREYTDLMRGYSKLSALRCELFEELVQRSRADGTTVIVFTTPIHPDLREYLLTSTDAYASRRGELITYLQRLAADHSLTFVDLSTIDTFQGDASEFVDGIHPLEANTRKMVDVLWAQYQVDKTNAVQ